MRKKLVQWLTLLIVLGAIGLYIRNHSEILRVASDVNPVSALIIFLLTSFYLLTNGLILKVLLNAFCEKISIMDSLGLSALTAMGNYLTSLGGGTISKAIYLKRYYGFSYPSFFASISATQIIDLFWVGLLGSVTVAFYYGFSEPWALTLFLCFFSLFIMAASLIILPFFFQMPGGGILRYLRDVSVGWNIIRQKENVFIKLSSLLLLNHTIASIEIFVGYYAFSKVIDIEEAFLLALITGILLLVKLTPANLGIQEAAVATVSHIIGIGFDEGLLAAGLIRVVSIGMIFLVGGLFSIRLLISGKAKEV